VSTSRFPREPPFIEVGRTRYARPPVGRGSRFPREPLFIEVSACILAVLASKSIKLPHSWAAGLAGPPVALLGAAHQFEHLVPVSSMLIKKCRYDTEPFATTQATSWPVIEEMRS